MSKALVFLAPGFEEVEAVTIVDILRRGEVDVDLVSITDELTLTGSHAITVTADKLLAQINDFTVYDALITPGGQPGSTHLSEDPKVLEVLRQASADKKIIASICASPMVLHAAGLTEGKAGTSFPGMKDTLGFADYREDLVVRDDRLITSRGPSTALLFALELVKQLQGDAIHRNVRKALLIPLLQEQIGDY